MGPTRGHNVVQLVAMSFPDLVLVVRQPDLEYDHIACNAQCIVGELVLHPLLAALKVIQPADNAVRSVTSHVAIHRIILARNHEVLVQQGA
jgi:hypothetical protein